MSKERIVDFEKLTKEEFLAKIYPREVKKKVCMESDKLPWYHYSKKPWLDTLQVLQEDLMPKYDKDFY